MISKAHPIVRQVHGGDAGDVGEGVPLNGGDPGVDQVQLLQTVRKVLELVLAQLESSLESFTALKVVPKRSYHWNSNLASLGLQRTCRARIA